MNTIRTLFARLDGGFLATLVLVSFSGIYLTKIGVSPVYMTSAVGLCMLSACFLGARGSAPMLTWAQALFTLLLALPVAIYYLGLQSRPADVMNFMLGPILGALIPICGRNLTREQLTIVARTFVFATLIVTTVECVYRLSHPDLSFLADASAHRDDVEDIAFYAYKFNSLMYLDSNFVGLQLALLFAFMLGLARLRVPVPRIWFAYTLVLTCLTLSRASVLACGFLLCVAGYRRVAKGATMRFLVLLVVGSGLVGVFFLIQNDPSFATKFDILDRFVRYLGRAGPFDILFGIGVGRAVDVLDIGAHNLIVTYVIEVGVVLTALVLGYWFRLARLAPVIGYLVLVWLVNGFSLTTLAIPYMYASAALLLLLHRRAAPAQPEVRAAPIGSGAAST